MQFSIIHFSDIHFKEEDCLKEKIEYIKSIVRKRIDKELIIIAVTGDIAFSGDKLQYTLANSFFSEIKKVTPKIRFCIVPGNHDCRFENKETVRKILIENICKNCNETSSSEVIKEIINVQTEFKNFNKKFSKEEKEITLLHSYSKFEIGKYKIIVNHLNTAWMSNKEEKQGTLFFPLEQLNFFEKGNFNIAIFHHNFNWFSADNAREIKKIIERKNELILTGHEHSFSYETRDTFENNVQHLEGSVLQDNSDRNNSGFNVIDVSLDNKSAILFEYKYSEKLNCYEEIENKINFKIKESITEYENENEFEEKFLYDMGADFHHPRKRNSLLLKDIYIYPDLKRINFDEKHAKKDEDYVSSIFFKNIKNKKNKFLIMGEEKSGKTTFAKVLYILFREKGFIPLYVNIENKSENINKLLKDSFSKQYNKRLYDKYSQENFQRKFLIIDNFERVKNKIKFLDEIEKEFDNIVILGNLLLEIDNVFYDEILSKNQKYQKFKIEEFGNKLRYVLIDKWNKLGLEYFDEKEISKKNEKAKKIIDMSIGKNIVPSYPIFILTSLQMLEMNVEQNLENSTQGYYYQFLITQSIRKFTTENLDTYFNFLSELSYEIYKSKELALTLNEIYKFHNEFKTRYLISPYFKEMVNFDILLEKFKKSNILVEDYNGISFKYKYIYYFFISKYFSDNINNNIKIQEEIKELIDKIYQEESANIILFLTHHTKDEFIIKKLLNNCEVILNKYKVINLTDDVVQINELVEKLPVFNIPENIKAEKNKIQNYKRQDNIERSYSRIENKKEETPEEVLELAKNLNLAFKSIEIIGNILKSYHGSLQKDIKIELAKEAYYICLRAISFVFEIITEDIELTTKRIENFISERKISSSYERKEIAKKFIFDFSSFVAFSFLEKVSSSLCFDKLSLIFDIIKQNNRDNNAIKIINLMMELTYRQEVPIDTMKILKDELKNNNIANFLLKTTIIKFLYFTSLNYVDRQKICSLFEIKPLKTIEHNVRRIKK